MIDPALYEENGLLLHVESPRIFQWPLVLGVAVMSRLRLHGNSVLCALEKYKTLLFPLKLISQNLPAL